MIEYISQATLLAPGIIRGVFVGLLVSLCAALLGTTLVLKRFSMIGDGLSHVAFGAMAIAAALGVAPLWIAVPVVVLAAIVHLRFCGNSGVVGDSAIALIATSSLAIGITLIKFAGSNISVSNYMFGSIAAVDSGELYLCVPLCIVIIIVFTLLYNKIFTVTFDEGFAKTSGVNVSFYNTAISVLTALTIVMGMKIMGTLLISGLIIFPALSAMRIFGSFKAVVASSAVISVICFFSGLAMSILFDTPIGASIIISNLILFIICSIIGRFGKKK